MMVPVVEGSHFWTFEAVQERLVEAMRCAWQQPDRERGWLTVRAYWPEMRRHNHFGDYGDVDAAPRPVPLSRAQLARMDEAFAWVDAVDAGDRRLVGLVLTRLAAGDKQVPWSRLKRSMGIAYGVHGLRKRYSRAMHKICVRANAGLARASVCQGGK